MDIDITYKGKGIAKLNFNNRLYEFNILRDNFSVIQKNYIYVKRCKAHNIRINPDKEYIKKSVISASGEFKIGLLNDILRFCKDKFYDRVVDIKLSDDIKKYILSNSYQLDTDIFVNENGDKLRDYQFKSMQIALNRFNGVYVLGTGAGKTLCCALLIHNILKYNISKKVLLICPFPDLANQTYLEIEKSLKKHNYNISRWFGKYKFNKESDVIIAGSDIIRSQWETYKDDLKGINAIIVDEVHQLKSKNKISDIISQFTTTNKFGFTGTLPDNKMDRWSLIGEIGPVRYELPSAVLRDNKFLTPVKVLGVNVEVKDIPKFKINEEGKKEPFTYQDEIEWLSENVDFNNIVCNIASKLNGNSLILINRLIHIDTLTALNYKDKQVFVIQGNVPIEERSDIKEAMEANNNVIVIAQVSTFSTGINVKNISNIIFPGTIGKSNIRIVQSIGRSLRLKEGKVISTIIDVVPRTKYSLKHWEERKRIYNSEIIPYTEVNLKN